MHQESDNVWVMDNLVRPDPNLVGGYLPIRAYLDDPAIMERVQTAGRMGQAAGAALSVLL